MAASFTDILVDAEPALQFGENAIEQEVTEARDWYFTFTLEDALGAPIDLQALGVTGSCVVYTSRTDSTPLITPTVTITGAVVEITATKAATANLAAGRRERICPWRFTLTHTATNRSCDVWSVLDSTLAIQEDTP